MGKGRAKGNGKKGTAAAKVTILGAEFGTSLAEARVGTREAVDTTAAREAERKGERGRETHRRMGDVGGAEELTFKASVRRTSSKMEM